MQLELVDSWGERSRGERSSFPHSSHQIVCPRMSVGYAEVLPFRGQASAYRTTLLGITRISDLIVDNY